MENSQHPVVKGARLPAPAWRKEKEKQLERGTRGWMTDHRLRHRALPENGKNADAMRRYHFILNERCDKEKSRQETVGFTDVA